MGSCLSPSSLFLRIAGIYFVVTTKIGIILPGSFLHIAGIYYVVTTERLKALSTAPADSRYL